MIDMDRMMFASERSLPELINALTSAGTTPILRSGLMEMMRTAFDAGVVATRSQALATLRVSNTFSEAIVAVADITPQTVPGRP